MKLTTFFNSALIVTSIAFIPGIASAQTANTNNGSGQINTDAKYLQPFNIAFLAYQGYLKEQGIPSGGALLFKYQGGSLTAEDIVQAAVKANKLPAQVLNDSSYLNALDSQLTSLGSIDGSCN
ncbi:hypothetical protein [Nostoc sp.]|uniref:hypothetical protein n=1 Tax=Nostoc sp. TaxID=1180 RepID=UPI002FF0BDE2